MEIDMGDTYKNKTMKEIHKLILKEKTAHHPNKDYIQWLQQLTDQELTENFIAEVKQKNFLEKLYKQNTIDFNDYFKYSGKNEPFKKIIDKRVWKNRMADRLNDYMNEKKN